MPEMDLTAPDIIFYAFAFFTFLFLVYLLRWLYYIVRCKAVNEDVSAPSPLSVIVCAHNEEENLRQLIPELLGQSHPDFEIVIVDDRSYDGTYDYLLELKEKEPAIRMVKVEELPEHVNGKKYGLTLGIKAARHDVIVLTDADCRPADKDWLKTMGSQFDASTQFLLGYSNYFKKKGLLNTLIRFETLFTGIQYIAEAVAGNPYMGVGRNLAYRKSFFLQKKGFNKHLKINGGDDDLWVNEFARGKTTKVAVGRKTLVSSIPKVRWKEYFLQKQRHVAAGKRYRKKDRFRIGLMGLSLILHWILLITLLILSHHLWWVALAYMLKLVVWLVLLTAGAGKLGDKYPVWKVPVLELYYLFYLLWGAKVTFSRKKIKWR